MKNVHNVFPKTMYSLKQVYTITQCTQCTLLHNVFPKTSVHYYTMYTVYTITQCTQCTLLHNVFPKTSVHYYTYCEVKQPLTMTLQPFREIFGAFFGGTVTLLFLVCYHSINFFMFPLM